MILPGALGMILLGLLLLAGGGEALVRGATALARFAGVTPAVIGLTIVAVGTSLPELVVSLQAASVGQADIAVANVVGSNIFNILGILGVTALYHPHAISSGLPNSDMVWMMGVALALFPVMWTGRTVSRSEGALLLAMYGAYLFMLLG